MQRVLLLFLFAQTVGAGLERYPQLVAADAKPVGSTDGLRVTYLGTNGYQFEAGNHVLLVDPYFSRIGLGTMIFGSSVRPNTGRIEEAMQCLAPKSDAILVTHGHVDHSLDAPQIMQMTGARLLGSRTAIQLAEAAGAPSARCEGVRVGDLRQIGPWKIRVLGATHAETRGRLGLRGTTGLSDRSPRQACLP